MPAATTLSTTKASSVLATGDDSNTVTEAGTQVLSPLTSNTTFLVDFNGKLTLYIKGKKFPANI